ncbi:MAG: hypothetical protein IPJ19_02760 [Planctomycetes bacterium]|nr:hypothetical protein [Planctomycetota bacterium]
MRIVEHDRRAAGLRPGVGERLAFGIDACRANVTTSFSSTDVRACLGRRRVVVPVDVDRDGVDLTFVPSVTASWKLIVVLARPSGAVKVGDRRAHRRARRSAHSLRPGVGQRLPFGIDARWPRA